MTPAFLKYFLKGGVLIKVSGKSDQAIKKMTTRIGSVLTNVPTANIILNTGVNNEKILSPLSSAFCVEILF